MVEKTAAGLLGQSNYTISLSLGHEGITVCCQSVKEARVPYVVTDAAKSLCVKC